MAARRALAIVLPALLVLLLPGAARAHPFGPPQTVSISRVDSASVRVHWQPGAPDDYTYLAVGLGVSPEDLSQQTGGLLAVKRDADRLTASPLFADYLVEHVAVTDDAGAPCEGVVRPVEHLVGDGVSLDFRCAAPTDAADVRVSLLTDLHPAYRTMATGPGGQRFAYSADATDHRWSLVATDAPPDLGRSAALQLSLVLVGLVALAGATTYAVRRTRRRTAP